MHVIFLDADTLGQDIDLSRITQHVELTQYGHTASDTEAIVQRIGNHQCVITNKVPITRCVLQRCPNLKVIFAAATGVDHIDVQSCHETGVSVCNTRHYTGSSLAQHVFASILHFTNHQSLYHQAVMNKTWSDQHLFCLLHPKIIELHGKKIGIIGYGNLGKSLAVIAQSFGLEVNICESFNTRAKASQTSEARLSFEAILTTSDFISIHCPLTPATQHLFSTQAFRAMKKSAYLINTARGAIVDSDALMTALCQNEIAGAALDVFEQEPLAHDHSLLQVKEKLLLTPHNAWGSLESRQRLVIELERNITSWVQGSIRHQCFP